MTLLEDVDSYLSGADLYCFDIQKLAAATASTVEETHIYLDRLRWGVLYGTVLSRYRGEKYVMAPFEYVMVGEYQFDEGTHGDAEISAWPVVPHYVNTIRWDRP